MRKLFFLSFVHFKSKLENTATVSSIFNCYCNCHILHFLINLLHRSLDTLVKGLSSDDNGRSAQALQEADRYLKSQQGFSRTVINRTTGSTPVVSV